MSATDPLDLASAIRARLVASVSHPDPRDEALLAVLELEPPPRGDDDPAAYALLTDGWQTCYRTVLLTIIEELEVAGCHAATREPDPGLDLVAAERAALLIGRPGQARRLDPSVGDQLRALGLVFRTKGGWYRLTEAGVALRARLEVPGA